MRRVLRARRACRLPGTPTAPRRPRAASVRSPSVSAGTVQSGASASQRPCVSRPCSVGEPREQWVVPEAAPEAGRADHLLGAVHLRPRPGSAAPAALERLVPLAAGGYEGASSRPSSAARSPGSVAWNAARPRREKSGRGTFSGRRARLAPPHRGDARARRERVPPLGRRRHPGADDDDVVGVVVRLVGVHRPRVVRRAPPARSARGGRSRPARGGTTAGRRASKPPSTARIRSIAARHDAVVPAGPRGAAPRRGRGTRRPSGGSGRRRVCTSGHGLPLRAAARTASPGNDVGRQWPSLSERIRRCRIDAARRRQAAAGSAPVSSKTVTVARRRRARASRTRRSRRGRRRRSRRWRHFTEPASSPWTK